MYKYTPPKSAIWGHSLRNMTPACEKKMFQQFLKTAVSEFRQVGGSLMILADPNQQIRTRFQGLLEIEFPTNFIQLAPHQVELCLDEIIENQTLKVEGTCNLLLGQGFHISKWLIDGDEIATESQILMYYGSKACISTILVFETVEQFQHIKQVMNDVGLCKLDQKHLKQLR